MSQMPPYKRGYRAGLRFAVTWLHARAAEMNDPHAVAILNSAATNLGWDIERELRRLIPPADQVEERRPHD